MILLAFIEFFLFSTLCWDKGNALCNGKRIIANFLTAVQQKVVLKTSFFLLSKIEQGTSEKQSFTCFFGWYYLFML